MPACCLCEKSIDTVEEAVEAGWFPSLYESGEPVCPECITRHCEFDEAGELVLRLGDEHLIDGRKP